MASSCTVSYDPDCKHVPSCCFNLQNPGANPPAGSACGALTSQCVYDVMDHFNTSAGDLFDTKGGVGGTLYNNVFYNPLIVAKRAKYCTDSNNYINETGQTNLCSEWWNSATDIGSWGLNDSSVSQYCDKYKMNNHKPYGPGDGTAEYHALPNDDARAKVDKICACYTSTMACPGAYDTACKGDSAADASEMAKKPGYHFQAQLNENCPPINVCMQNTTVSPFSFIFGSKQQQECTTVTGSPQQIFMYLEFIIIFFCALFLISIFYTTSVLRKVQTR
jgi:hypothetical protein